MGAPLRGAMHKLITRRVVVAAMLAVVVACGQEPTRPPVTSVLMSSSVTPAGGSPASPVTIDISVTNAGQTQVWYTAGCGCEEAIFVTVLGPDSSAVLLSDPNYPYSSISSMCPCGPVAFPHGETLRGGVGFTGTLYDRHSTLYPCPTYAAPPGRYTVIAEFEYSAESGARFMSPGTTIKRSMTFDWQP